MGFIMKKIFLYLEDGQSFQADSFGHEAGSPYISEIVFNTSMQGYQEVFSDPSYCDQSLVMTYPLIGNYGVNQDDSESIIPYLKTVIIRENCEHPSNFRNTQSLQDYLKARGIVGICNIDTRQLAKTIRSSGTMKCLVSMQELDNGTVISYLKQELARDQIQRVSTKAISHFPANGGMRVILIDYGYKKNILESLLKRGCDVIVVPYNTDFETIKGFNPQGILLSNGPGDPDSILEVLPTVKKLQETYPMFCICMGHEIFALANGAKIEKMKFGHRGGNHPVKDFEKNRVYITAQNHGYCVDSESIKETDLEVTQINLNDKTLEGLRHKTLPSFSVQYHPEASPGPHDTNFMFDTFTKMLGDFNNATR
jgi:carbamoyl-phosphate synthase small subunit